MSPENLDLRGTVPVAGFELGYSIEGSGPTALVIGSAVYYPRTFNDHLRQHLRLVFVDHRGFGNATAPYTEADFLLDTLLEDVEAVRQALGLGQVIIVGHSGHGYLALEYAKKYPQHVSHIVLIALSPDSTPASFEAADRYFEESVDPQRKALYAESMAHLESDIAADPQHRFIHYSLRSGPRIWFDPTYDARTLWQGLNVNPEMFDYVWGRLFRELDIFTGLDALEQPVFVALGRYDFWNPPQLWEAARPHVRDLRIRVFERSGHTPQYEQPDDFDRELLAWLGERG